MRETLVVTLPDEQQVLIDLFDTGDWHVSWRPVPDTKVTWLPLDLAGGSFRTEET